MALLAVIVFMAGAQACSRGGQSGVEGRVTGHDVFGDLVGYSHARVIVMNATQTDDVAIVHADQDGRYSITLKPGQYHVDLFTGSHPKTPSTTVPVSIGKGEMVEVPTYQAAGYPAGSDLSNQAIDETRKIVRDEAERLHLVKRDLMFTVYGSHAGTAARYVTGDLPQDRHVYVVILPGKPTAESPPGGETEALRHGGYIALLVTADDFRVHGKQVFREAWDPDAGNKVFMGGWILPAYW